MARIYMEGFESGGMQDLTYRSSADSTPFSGLAISNISDVQLGAGRLPGGKSLKMYRETTTSPRATITLPQNPTEFYARVYFKFEGTADTADDFFTLYNTNADAIVQLDNDNTSGLVLVKIRYGGAQVTVGNTIVAYNTWYRLEVYYKADSSTGAYEVRLDGVTLYSGSGLNTDVYGVDTMAFNYQSLSTNKYLLIDDIAVNDTTGTANNSWPGEGNIIAVRPKAAGNTTQLQAYTSTVAAESSTSATNINLTSHGLTTNSIVYNITRDTFRDVSGIVDANNFTVATVTGQVPGDEIECYLYEADSTVTSTEGVTDSISVNTPLDMVSGDVYKNVTDGDYHNIYAVINPGQYQYAIDSVSFPDIGDVGGQTIGDDVRFARRQLYTTTTNWQVTSERFNPRKAIARATASGEKDTYDMQELVADLGYPSNVYVNAIAHSCLVYQDVAGGSYKPVLRISGTDYAGPTATTVEAYKDSVVVYDVDPATSSSWTVAGIDALEAGIEAV